MSFINTGMKPKLVEIKVVEKIIKVQQDNKPYNFKIWKILCNFVINNLFIITIFTLIGMLLMYRYFDVQNRKKKKIKDDSEEEQINEDIENNEDGE
jgi:hypothetical protein